MIRPTRTHRTVVLYLRQTIVHAMEIPQTNNNCNRQIIYASSSPVQSYHFNRRRKNKIIHTIRGYRKSRGSVQSANFVRAYGIYSVWLTFKSDVSNWKSLLLSSSSSTSLSCKKTPYVFYWKDFYNCLSMNRRLSTRWISHV